MALTTLSGQILFIGVMSDLYVLWDVRCLGCFFFRRSGAALTHFGTQVIDDTIARKVNSSDASHFAHICGCFPSQGTTPRRCAGLCVSITGLACFL